MRIYLNVGKVLFYTAASFASIAVVTLAGCGWAAPMVALPWIMLVVSVR